MKTKETSTSKNGDTGKKKPEKQKRMKMLKK